MGRESKFIPRFDKKQKSWIITFPAGFLKPSRTKKHFNSEEKARQYVLNLIPDAYDIKIETERKCRTCLQILPIENFVSKRQCKICKSKKNIKRQSQRTKNNICVSCKNIKLKNSRYCFNHWFQNNARQNLKNSNLGIDLINLYEKQNCKCVYTGVELIPAVNMSLDHIVSRYDNKDLIHDINNVQWVHKDINVMKNRFSHENFVKLCKYIANKF